jgi:hypothetical protein
VGSTLPPTAAFLGESASRSIENFSLLAQSSRLMLWSVHARPLLAFLPSSATSGGDATGATGRAEGRRRGEQGVGGDKERRLHVGRRVTMVTWWAVSGVAR